MATVKVQSIGEHVVITPGRLEVEQPSGLQFDFHNTCGGEIEILFLHDNLQMTYPGTKVTRGTTVGVAHNASSPKFTIPAGAPLGEYDYVVIFDSPASMSIPQARLGAASVGVAIGGSSPRIIVKAPTH